MLRRAFINSSVLLEVLTSVLGVCHEKASAAVLGFPEIGKNVKSKVTIIRR